MSDITKRYQQIVTTHSDISLFIKKIQNPDDESIIFSAAQEKKLERMYVCKDHIYKRGSRNKIIPLLMNQFGVSRAEANRIYKDTIDVFDDDAKPKGRNIVLDLLYQNILEDRNKAMAKDDFKSMVAADKLLLEFCEKFLGGHEAELYRNIQPPDPEFIYDPVQLDIKESKNLEADIAALKKSKERNNDLFDEAEVMEPDE